MYFKPVKYYHFYLVQCVHFSFKATVLCDICVLYFLKMKKFYKSMKYQNVYDPGDDGFPIDNEVSSRYSTVFLYVLSMYECTYICKYVHMYICMYV